MSREPGDPDAAPIETEAKGRDKTRDSSRPEASEPGRDREKPVPEFVRRLIEAGFEKLSERPDLLRQKLLELRLPKESLEKLLLQLDDGKSGLYRVAAKEVRDFLESTHFAEDLVKALTKLSFEIRTEIRLIPNDHGGAKPDVQMRTSVKHRDPSDRDPKATE